MRGKGIFLSLVGTVTLLLGITTSTVHAQPANAASSKITTPQLLTTATLTNSPSLGDGINLGGFSSLVHVPGDPQNVFYTNTDRGPNGTVTVDGVDQTAFPIPTFTPRIVKIEVVGSTIKILKQIPLKLAHGTDPITGTRYISGVSNVPTLDEAPYDSAGNPLPYDPYGLDTEGIAYSPQTHTFWLSEEYRPSVVEIAPDGTILRRIVPQGETSYFKNAKNVPILDTLPAIFSDRVQNKGLEGVAITPDGRYMYTAMQGPLANPDADSTTEARVLRIAEIDLHTLNTIKEFAYLTPDASQYPKLDQSKIFISDLSALNDNTLLVDERDSKTNLKSIVEINVNKATNILHFTTYQGQTLEQMTVPQLQQAGILFPDEKVILDLLQYGYPFEKVEGLAVVGNDIAVVNDNDFDVDDTDPTQLWLFQMPKDAFHAVQ
jgi:hypothetical protein